MTRLIKKYKNRRLYDTETSKYITIDDIKQYVLAGIEFQVQDAATHENLTNPTLLQILFEIGSDKSAPFFSTPLLRQLISISNHPMSRSFQTLLENIVNSIENSVDEKNHKKHIEKATEIWNQQLVELSHFWKNFLDK